MTQDNKTPNTHTYSDLTDSSPYLDTVVEWIHDEWSKTNGDSKTEIRNKILNECDAPLSQVAVIGFVPVGLVWINRFKLPEQAEAKLWINALIVVKEHRKEGLGSALLKRAQDLCAAYDSSLFAYTDIPAFYFRLNWQLYKEKDASGSYVVKYLNSISQTADLIE